MFNRVDPTLRFLAVVMFMAGLFLIASVVLFPTEGEMFQVFAGVLTGTMAIFGRGASKGLGVPDGAEQNGSTTKTSSTVTATTTVSPPEPKG